MKVSVLIVTYNQERFVKECIESVLVQVIPYEYEIIVADDCSTDSTIAVTIEALKHRDVNFRIMENTENLGLEKNYKRGFEACTGEYIATLEGDDYWTDPKRLQKHVDFLDNHYECSMSFNRLIEFYEENKDYKIKDWVVNEDHTYFTTKELAKGNQIGNFSACVFRNSAFHKINQEIFNIRVTEWEMAMVFGQFGLIGYLKDPMSVYRIHNRGLWKKNNRTQQINLLLANIDKYDNYFNYQYKQEFYLLNTKLTNELSRINKPRNSRICLRNFIPPFLILVIELLLPEIVIRKLKKLIP
jgi:glycosyltransferase involved in cell wall biosynthesis